MGFWGWVWGADEACPSPAKKPLFRISVLDFLSSGLLGSVWGLGSGVWGCGGWTAEACQLHLASGSGFLVQGFGSKVFGFRVLGPGLRVLGFGVLGVGRTAGACLSRR